MYAREIFDTLHYPVQMMRHNRLYFAINAFLFDEQKFLCIFRINLEINRFLETFNKYDKFYVL